jgi:fluoride exporter
MAWLLVGTFGALGCVARFGVALALAGRSSYPLATWLVNVVGSFALGVVSEALVQSKLWGVDARVVLGTGLLGGFTTYSAFDIETLRMLERGEWLRGGLYVALTVLACLGAGFAGLAMGRALLR